MDSLLALYKELAKEGPVSKELIEQCEKAFPVGSTVEVLNTGYKGVITGYNTSTGFYHGNRYPVLVKITSSADPKFSDAVGIVFEYGVNQLSVLPV